MYPVRGVANKEIKIYHTIFFFKTVAHLGAFQLVYLSLREKKTDLKVMTSICYFHGAKNSNDEKFERLNFVISAM